MRLRGRRQSQNVIDSRGKRVAKKAGGFSLIGIIIALVMAYLNKDPSYVMREVGKQATSSRTTTQQTHQPTRAENEAAVFTSQILASTEDVWNQIFQQAGSRYRVPKLELFTGEVRSACGVASAQAGPFYCSGDEQVYIDLSFLNEMQRMGAKGDFAFAYVIAHEVGHHISNLVGTLPKVHKARHRLNPKDANALSVLLELQADCFAGVWGHYANNYQQILSPGDIEEGIRAAQAVGDDTITQGRVHPDNFTHGTAEQRMSWFMTGMRSGDIRDCNTFGQAGIRL